MKTASHHNSSAIHHPFSPSVNVHQSRDSSENPPCCRAWCLQLSREYICPPALLCLAHRAWTRASWCPSLFCCFQFKLLLCIRTWNPDSEAFLHQLSSILPLHVCIVCSITMTMWCGSHHLPLKSLVFIMKGTIVLESVHLMSISQIVIWTNRSQQFQRMCALANARSVSLHEYLTLINKSALSSACRCDQIVIKTNISDASLYDHFPLALNVEVFSQNWRNFFKSYNPILVFSFLQG